MASPFPIADAIQAGSGIVSGAIGLINEGKAKEEARRLAATRPQYQVDPLVNQDLNLAESELSSNVSSGEKAYATLNNGQFSSAIGSTLKAGGDPNSVGAIYGNSEDGRLKLQQMRDNLRLNQIQNVLKTSQNKQDANTTAFLYNKDAPWKDAAQANAAARQAAQQQVSQGFNTFISGGMNGANSLQEDNNLKLPTYNNNPDYNRGGYATGVPTGNLENNDFSSANYLSPNNNFPRYNPNI
jgi:hypothetical protein